MAKVTLTNPGTFVADASAVAQTANNNAAITAAIENTLSRDGTGPNQMSAPLDMNSQRIINLPAPVSNSEPARLADVGQAPVSAAAAAASAAAALASQNQTAADVVTTGGNVTASAANATAAASSIQALSGTSVTSQTIGLGSFVFATQTGKNWPVGTVLIVASSASPTNAFHGVVTTYAAGNLTITSQDVTGSGTFASWNIFLSGTQGTQGPTGPQGNPGSGTIAGATNHGVAIATGASAVTSTAVMTDGQLLVGHSAADPTPTTVTGDVTITSAGVTAIGALKVLGSMIAAATIDLTAKVLGILPGANGGTGSGFFAVSGPTTSLKTFAFPNLSDTVATWAGQNVFTKQQTATIQTLTDAATVAWDCSLGQKARVTYAGNRTMGAVTNAVEGTSYFLWAVQDATGTRVPTWTTSGAGSFDFGLLGAPTLTTTASQADLLCFEAVSIAGTLKLRFCGIQRAFS